MSHNQPPAQPPLAPEPPAPSGKPKWARKRVVIPAALVILFIGVGIGSSGSSSEKTAAGTTPQPTVTVTTIAPGKAAGKPQPTVTVTKTVNPKVAKSDSPAASDEGAKGKVVFKVWGSAPSGAEVTYGSDSDSRQGSGLPMTKTLTLNDEALYYQVSAQLMGGGDINCSVTVNGKTKKGHASGGYNICTAQLNGGILGGWN